MINLPVQPFPIHATSTPSAFSASSTVRLEELNAFRLREEGFASSTQEKGDLRGRFAHASSTFGYASTTFAHRSFTASSTPRETLVATSTPDAGPPPATSTPPMTSFKSLWQRFLSFF